MTAEGEDPIQPALHQWMTTKQAAEYCQVSVQTFRRMVKRIPIRPARPAGPKSHPRFFRSDLDAALRSTIEKPAELGRETVKGSAP